MYVNNLKFTYYIIECNIFFFLSISNTIHYNIEIL